MAPTDDNTCPVPTTRRCQAGTKVSQPFCVDDGDCGTAQIQKTEVIAADCSAVVSYQLLGLNGAVAGAWAGSTKQVSCEPMRVKVVDKCDTKPTAPITITGIDCAGAPIVATGLPQQIVQTVPHPTAVQPVKLCGPIANLKIEFSETLLFSASTEQSLFRIKEYNEDTGTWVTRYENLDGTPFTGALPADLSRASALVNVTRTQILGCAAGVPYTMRETARFDAETGALESEVIDWLNSAGIAQATPPVGFLMGACDACEASTPVGVVSTWG